MEKVEFKSFLKYPNFFCSLAGLPKFKEKGNGILLWFWFLCLVNFLASTLEMIYIVEAIRHKKNFLQITELIPCFGYTMMAPIKALTIKWNTEKFCEVLEFIQRRFSSSIADQKQLKIHQKLNKINAFFWILIQLYLILVAVYSFVPCFEMAYSYLALGHFEKSLPYFYWFPFNPYKNNVLYVLCYFVQVFSAFFLIVEMLAADLLFYSASELISIQYNVLSHKLSGQKPSEEDLKQIVEEHNGLIQICQKVDQIYSQTLFLNFMGSSLFICFLAFQAMVEEHTSIIQYGNVLRAILFSLASLIQLLSICVYGSNIIEASSSVAQAAYESDWTQMDIKRQNFILIIIQRSQKPERVTAMKFYEVSCKSCTMVCIYNYLVSYLNFILLACNKNTMVL